MAGTTDHRAAPARSIAARLALGVLAVAAATGVSAQTWPGKPVRVIIPWATGGSTDALGRIVVQRLSETLGQPFVVENRAGAAGTIGTALASKAAPDGYTMLVGTNSTFVMAPFLYKDLGYDNDKALAPVMLISRSPQAITVHPSVPVKTLREFIEFARKRPGQVNFSSAGNGATSHMATEMLRNAAKLDMVHIPYKGGGPSFQALLSGETALSFVDVITVLEQARAGRVRVLALSSLQRSPLLPDVPTASEAGLPGFDTHTSFAAFMPAGTPREIVNRLNAALAKVLAEPATRDRLVQLGMEIVAGSPEEFVAYQKREADKWGRVVRENKITIE
jgi:tripartite-type tricarboxylate transporter receptor subunit TctC